MTTAVQRRAFAPGRLHLGRRAKIVLSGLLLAALLVWRLRGRSEPEIRVETAAVSHGSIAAKVTATGTLSAVITVQVGSQVSGRIADLLVDFNSPVKKGQVLARIDPLLFEAAVEQARANDLAARANLTKARSSFENARTQANRARALRSQQLISQSDADDAILKEDVARSEMGAARAAIEQTAAALNQARTNLAYATIRSPINGIVISRNVDVGQTVAASFQAPVLFVLAEDLRRMQVDSSVAEADVGRLTAGMSARFTVDAYPGRDFEGTIRQIRNAAQTVQNVVTYDAVIDVPNDELLLKPGMTANITFVYAQRDDVLRIPNAALRFRPPPDWTGKTATRAVAKGDKRTLWRMVAEKPESVEVRVGVSDGTVTELVEGPMNEGDALITEVLGGKKSGPGSYGRML